MTPRSNGNFCPQAESVAAYALRALPVAEAAEVAAHLASCPRCLREFDMLRPVIERFAFWPADVLRPDPSLQERLARRIAAETGGEPVVPPAPRYREPQWQEVAPGISCKLLAKDDVRDIVSMLVKLAPGGEYPPHTHAGVEELFLLDGELWIDDRKLHAGDYIRAEPGTGDRRVWSETGCTCVLVTSTRDTLE